MMIRQTTAGSFFILFTYLLFLSKALYCTLVQNIIGEHFTEGSDIYITLKLKGCSEPVCEHNEQFGIGNDFSQARSLNGKELNLGIWESGI